MTTFLLRRLTFALFVLWVAVTFTFVLTNAVGDPAVATLGAQAHKSQLDAFRRKHHLNRPLPERYVSYLSGVLHGDLGKSFTDERSVSEVIATRLPRTALLGLLALGFELALGLLIGIIAAVKRNTWMDAFLMSVSFLGISVPTFLSGVVFLYWFAFRLGWFPVGGYGMGWTDHLRHALLPAFTLALIGAASYARMVRSDLIEVLQADYMRTARAKGLSFPRVLTRHGLRNALIPVATLVGLSLPTLVSGAIITETVYAWPGMGRLAVESIYALDVFTVTGVVLVTSAAVQVGALIADLTVAWLDPRTR